MQSIFGERERPNWCVGVSAVTMQHHESLPLTACMNALAACMNGLTACINGLTACMNIDRLHERVDRLHEGLHEGIVSLNEHATTGWAGKEGQLWLCCNG